MTKTTKPKGPIPSLIGSTLGTPRRVPVERTSECRRCKIEIQINQNCIAIPHLKGSFQSLKRYCEECFKNILEKTKTDLEDLNSL